MELKITNYMSWWNKDDRYSKQILIGDIEKIRSFYMNSGYLDFKIESSTVSISKSKKDVFIAITVDEGKKYSFGNSRITGNIPEQINVDDLKDKVKLENGKTFNRSLVNESTQDISKLLGNYGYAFANVNALPNVNKEKLIVDFNINVDPGKMIYVRRVNIIGNSSTKDEVIRRELRQYESSWFSQEKIDISKQRITRTQFFESVNIETPTVPGTSDQVDLNIILKETNTGKFSIGAGVSSSEGVVGSLSVTQGNFLGTGNRVSTEISTGGINKVWSLSFLDPYWTTDGISRGFSVNYRDLDTKDLNTGDYATKSYGAGVNFGIPLDEFRRLTFGAEIDFTELDLKSNSPQGYKNYCADISGAGSLTCDSDSILFFTAWSDNTLNSPFIPTSGHKYTVNIDVTTPGLDLEYYKLQAKFEKYFPLSDSVSTKIKIGAGFADSYGDNAYPFFKNFRVGGKNSVRGFKEGAIGKKTYDANYGKNVTYGGKKMLMVGAETFFPVPFMKKSESFRLGIFAEGGAPFEDSINTSDMRYSVGLSALWVSSFGPLSVSLGFPVNDDANDQLEKFQFGMGSSF